MFYSQGYKQYYKFSRHFLQEVELSVETLTAHQKTKGLILVTFSDGTNKNLIVY